MLVVVLGLQYIYSPYHSSPQSLRALHCILLSSCIYTFFPYICYKFHNILVCFSSYFLCFVHMEVLRSVGSQFYPILKKHFSIISSNNFFLSIPTILGTHSTDMRLLEISPHSSLMIFPFSTKFFFLCVLHFGIISSAMPSSSLTLSYL